MNLERQKFDESQTSVTFQATDGGNEDGDVIAKVSIEISLIKGEMGFYSD